MKLHRVQAEALKSDVKELYVEDFYGKEGLFVQVLFNDKLLKRKVRYRKDCGLYIVVNNWEIYLTDLCYDFVER